MCEQLTFFHIWEDWEPEYFDNVRFTPDVARYTANHDIINVLAEANNIVKALPWRVADERCEN